jgi:hypothetical protein
MLVADYFQHSMKPSDEAEEKGEMQWANRAADISFSEAELHGLIGLFMRPWFERLWIRQEVRLATQAKIICGFDSLSWNVFQNAIFCLVAKINVYEDRVEEVLGLQYGVDFFIRLELIRGLCNPNLSEDFTKALDAARNSKCSDPRDRVFALLSTSNTSTRAINIIPDYRKSIHEVYQDVFIRYVTRYIQSLHNLISDSQNARTDRIFLVYPSFQQSLLSLSILTSAEPKNFWSDWPSWVPDWTTPRRSRPLNVFKAGGISYSKVEYLGSGQLKTWGVKTATIQGAYISGFNEDFCPDHIVIDSVRRLIHQVLLSLKEWPNSENNIDTSDDKWLEAFCVILSCGQFGDEHVPPIEGLLERHIVKEIIRSCFSLSEFKDWPLSLTTKAAPIASQAQRHLRYRSVLLTTDGQIGIGPELSEDGDEIVVFSGCWSPMVLRSSIDGRYKVVGECYFDAMAHGNVFLGPLPEHYKIIPKFSKAAMAWHDFYHNAISGTAQISDPRFDPARHRLLSGIEHGLEPGKV